MNRKELKEYVSAGKIGTVIDHLKNIIALKNDNELADIVVSIQANYMQLIKQEINSQHGIVREPAEIQGTNYP